jgi:tetratricopeptide (TPR) repeat protein
VVTGNTDRLAEFSRLFDDMPEGAGAGVELLIRKLGKLRGGMLRKLAITHSADAAILRVLDSTLPEDKVEDLIANFARLSFLSVIDDRLVMHDEVRSYLLNWWRQDANRQEYAKVSEWLASYFTNLSEGLDGVTQAEALRRAIYHRIGADPDRGFAEFERRFRSGRYRHAMGECASLISMVGEHKAIFTSTQRLWFKYHKAKLLVDTYRFTDAEKKYTDILSAERIPEELETRVLFRMGTLFGERQVWNKAIDFYNRALGQTSLDASEIELRQRILDGLATALRETNQLEEAETVLDQSLSIAEQAGNDWVLARCHNGFGLLHSKRGDAKLAIESFNKSLTYLERNKEWYRQAQVYNNLGLAWGDLGDWEKSKDYLERSQEIEQQAGDNRRRARTLANLVRVHVTLGETEKGFALANEAVALLIQVHDWYEAGRIKQSMARVLRRQDKIQQARKEFTEAADLFSKADTEKDRQGVEEEIQRLERKKGMPWYAWLAIVVGALVLISMLIAIVDEL